nr:hypothetical protein [Photobacterium galatheae]
MDAEVVHEWTCILRSKVKLLTTLILGGVGSLVVGVMYYFHPEVLVLIIFGGTFLVFMPISYFLFSVDYDYKGQITPKGIIIQKTERVPEIFYKATRGMAYFGIGVCLIAGLMMGPLAFVGAGAFALLSFKMTGFHKQTEVEVFPFAENHHYRLVISKVNDLYQWDIYMFLCDVPDFINTSLYEFHLVDFECKRSDFPEIENILKRYIQISD